MEPITDEKSMKELTKWIEEKLIEHVEEVIQSLKPDQPPESKYPHTTNEPHPYDSKIMLSRA